MPKKAEAKTGSSSKTTKKTVAKKDVKAEVNETNKTAEKVSSKKVNKTANSVDTNESSSNSTPSTGSKFELSSFKEKVAEIENNILQKIKENPTITGKPFRKLVSVNKLMETGAHIGLTTRKWNPKMKKFIYTKKGNNHIIDLLHTVISLNVAYNFLLDLVKANSNSESSPVLIVGTRGKTIKNHVKEQAKRSHAFYINERWLGGTLTNFSTITKSVAKFNNLILIHKNGEINKYTKKEQVELKKKTEKYAKYFSGIRTMKELPKVIILTDPEINKIAIKEARNLGIPVIAICNTNANPDLVDYVIPANNHSIKSVYLLVGLLCDAVAEAKGLPKAFAEKKDEEILLPEVIKRKPENRRQNNHSFNKN